MLYVEKDSNTIQRNFAIIFKINSTIKCIFYFVDTNTNIKHKSELVITNFSNVTFLQR